MEELILTTTTGEANQIAAPRDRDYSEKCDTLQAARRCYFGRRGKISYTNMIAECDGNVISFRPTS